jgi:exosortase A
LAAASLAAVALAFVVTFQAEAAHAVQVWNESTAYNHCYLIAPITAYLIWERRRALIALAPSPSAWPLLAMLPVCGVWLFAQRLQVMEGRQLAAMTLFQLFALAALGFRAWRVIAFALLYLYFLVPAGAFLTPALQEFSARFAVRSLTVLGIPVYSDGMEIDVPGARFVVAEACAGLRFLIASIALGTLYGYMIYRSATRRVAFVAVSIVVPIIANGFRVLGIVVLGFWLGDARAAAADHLIYGWVFFSMVSLILIVLGLPFREAVPDFPIDAHAPGPRRGARIAMLFVSVAAIGLAALLVSPAVSAGPAALAADRAIAALRSAIGR